MASLDLNRLRQQYTLGGQDYGMNMGQGNDILDYGSSPEPDLPSNSTYYSDAPPTPQMDPRIPAPQGNLAKVGDTQNQSIQDLAASLDKIYHPEYASRDRLNTLLGQYPEDRQPSFIRRLVAGSMGMSARNHNENPLKAMDDVLDAPHRGDVEDWKNQVAPDYQAADLENRSNINERTLAGNILTNKYQTDRITEQGRIADAKDATNRARIESQQKIANQKLQLEGLRDRNYKFDFKGPTVMASRTNPDTGKVDLVDTGYPTGNLDEAEKINLQNAGKIEAARQFGANQANTATIRGYEVYTDSEGTAFILDPTNKTVNAADGSSRKPVGGLNKPATTPKPPTGSAATVADQKKLRDIYNNYPQYQTRKFWREQSDGSLALAPRPTMGSWLQTDASDSADIAAWDALNKIVNPGYVPPNSGGTTPQPTKSGANPQAPKGATPKAPLSGRVVIYKDGKAVGTIPMEQRDEAVKQGYTVK